MAKKKDSIALFEVMVKGRGTPKETADHDVAVEPAARPSAEGVYRTAPPVEAEQPASGNAVRWTPRRLLLGSADSERIKVSLSPTGWMCVAAGMLLLVLFSFSLGRMSVKDSYPQSAEPVVTNARSSEPAHKLAAVAPTPTATLIAPANAARQAPVAPPVDAPSQQKHFVVIQQLLKDNVETNKADAGRIVEFLAEHGVASFVYPSSNGKYQVIANRPFDRQNDPAADKFKDEIKRLGRQYGRDGYDFNAPYVRPLPWPISEDMKVK